MKSLALKALGWTIAILVAVLFYLASLETAELIFKEFVNYDRNKG